MCRARTRLVLAVCAVALVAAACSDDAGQTAADPYPTVAAATDEASTIPFDVPPSTSESPTSTTEPGPTDTIDPSAPPPRQLTAGDLGSSDGTTGAYRLTLDTDGLLCFAAEVTNPDPDLALGLSPPLSECVALTDDIDGDLAVSVGALDGDKRWGYLWGRTTPAVARLDAVFDNSPAVDVALIDADGTQVFATVIDTADLGEAESLDAFDAGGTLLQSESIRGFLRAGPGYPEVTPTPTTLPVNYPTTGG